MAASHCTPSFALVYKLPRAATEPYKRAERRPQAWCCLMKSSALDELAGGRGGERGPAAHQPQSAGGTYSSAGLTPIAASMSLPVPFSKIKCERFVLG
jgi:hypothetical protein